ncbi:threonylcarbamoyl-AMP synthase [Candidatus Daviesbacteria bacterium]|nr:threonylcarbamoyl-AMP synthase [Candidatus Daviesbacteria bacterium]
MSKNLNKDLLYAIKLLKEGKIVVLPTDTIYGIHGSIKYPETIERIYQLRKRDLDKPMVIVTSSIDDIKKLGLRLSKKIKQFLDKIWPNPVSVVLECNDDKLFYLHRGTYTLAFRIPKNELLLQILKVTGPLVSTSVNFQNEKSAETINKAKNYFGKKIDFYLDEGKIKASPSTVLKIKNKKIEILRQGAFKVNLVDL